MKIFTSRQIRDIDEYTIKNEPVSSIDLMERAAVRLLSWITDNFPVTCRVVIFAGPGNNGGDGLALARLLSQKEYDVHVCYIKFRDETSLDFALNRQRLEVGTNILLNTVTATDQIPQLSTDDLIVDAILGSGLTRPVDGLPGEVIKIINNVGAKVVSIDIPSGLFGEDNSKNYFDSVIRATYTLSFQFPKLSFMFADNYCSVGKWEVLPIGLDETVIKNTPSVFSMISVGDLYRLLKKRNQFDHKGNFGHGLLISGSEGKMGASILSASASLRTGIGLVTCHIPSCGNLIMQSALPEAMVKLDISAEYISKIVGTSGFNAVGIGPGMGTEAQTQNAFYALLKECKKPMVIDADALNILSLNKKWYNDLPPGTILTPHPKEFERLAGESENGFIRLEKQIKFSIEHKCIVILKGAHTSISSPDGKVQFNNSGNPGMATAGSGDVLTGIILSLLSQGYRPENAAILGVALHGIAGDIAANLSSYEAIIASDIINNIGKAFNYIRKHEL